MSADQTPPYQATPITQRDGSKLANSNCRMASIATGLDYDTLGAKKSTGKRMRSYTSDQSGGTDSRDAREAWAKGYGESLRVKDGSTWAQLLADLKDFRLVHIDVWHKTVGADEVCISGTGAYGHTMAVAPDCKSGQWLVSDPWCNPPKWTRVPESRLKAAAEEWGNRVYGAATSGPGRDWKANPPTLNELRAAARTLMQRYHAGGLEDLSEDPGDTGGGQRIMYTTTDGHLPATGGGSGSMGILFSLNQWTAHKVIPIYLDTDGVTKVTEFSAGAIFTSLGYKAAVDENGADSSWTAVRISTGGLIPGDSPRQHAILWVKKADMPPSSMPTPVAWDEAVWTAMGEPTGVFSPDEVVKAVNARDDKWREWLLAGSPGQRDGPAAP